MNRPTQWIILIVLAVGAGVLSAWVDTGPAGSQADDPDTRAREYLQANADRLKVSPDLRDLEFIDVRQGISSQHVRYEQKVSGVPVFGKFLTVSLPADQSSSVRPFVSGNYEKPGAVPPPSRPVLDATAAIAVAGNSVSLTSDNLRGAIGSELVYYPTGADKGAEHVLAWKVTAPTREPLGSWLFIVKADNGEVLLQQDLLRFDSGRVFDQNPAKTSGGLIPPPSDCDSPGNESTLSSQYATRTLRGINAGQDKLIGEFVDLSAPGISNAYKPAAVADEPTRNYVYGCDDDRFEEVMVYYQIDTLQRKIQALGFTGSSGIIDRPISAHAHYFDDCNAFFDPVNLAIHFGDGDICSPSADAAEDADVIVHEYGHAIQHDQVPGWGFGNPASTEQAWAMGEGFGDFLAAAISGDPCLGEWFNIGFTQCGGAPGLRNIDNTNHYPEDFEACRPSPPKPAEPHCAGLIWGGALWDLVQALGGDQAARDTVLTLVLDSQFYLDPWSTLAEAAAAIRQSDTLLNGGANVTAIDSVFSARGISSVGAVTDFPYAYLRVLHAYRGDLDVQIQVGTNVNSPDCTIEIQDPGFDPTDNLVGFLDLSGDPCAAYLPPSPATPWRLEVADTFPVDTGSIEQFEIVLSGASRCLATDVPIAIPDNDGFVYSTVDCTTIVSPAGDSDGDTIPDLTDTDDDNDGYSDATELAVGTDHLDACADTVAANDEADDKWPPDFDDSQWINILDIVKLTPPAFGSTNSDPHYSARKDLMPDGVINILDIVLLTPPFFNSRCS